MAHPLPLRGAGEESPLSPQERQLVRRREIERAASKGCLRYCSRDFVTSQASQEHYFQMRRLLVIRVMYERAIDKLVRLPIMTLHGRNLRKVEESSVLQGRIPSSFIEGVKRIIQAP